MHERLTTQSYAFRSPVKAGSDKTLLVCFSHLRWDFVWQRPQHLLSRAARHYDVLIVEEPLFKAGVRPHMDVSGRPQGVTVAVPILPEGLSHEDVLAEQHDLIEELIGREAVNPRVFWYYTPMAMAFTSDLECDLCIYDNMDELSLFRGASQELLDLENALFARCDLVFTGGLSLYEAKKNRHRSVHAFPSSIDFHHFAQARSMSRDPEDQAAIGHVRIGFFGVVDERMDLDLLAETAALRPDWNFVMIGPVVKIDPSILPRRANIHWLGGKSYNELPHYLSGWDAGFMNFALNEATKFISPTKTPEFLAAGVPVVSTPITDVMRPYGEKGLVEIARTAQEVVAKVETLLERPKDPWLAKVDRHLAAGSWDKTWASMHRLMLEAMGETAKDRPASSLPGYATTPAE
ncbi:glycosyltransferase involved in cell wall biosynthesis [Microvirga flocculans]|uniref:Glycosyltransferase involved in cell wall biosynthesis n=1 Tax=Microvirga flocculans TaxID=217168 RepID=A0A7W6IFM5_9HYPH|nr:glycosyltransferase [Microvirga flocculans]MBB4040587.1 glycosyltransferase involved in cell wall biosynthesis [Microvirga flocculans]